MSSEKVIKFVPSVELELSVERSKKEMHKMLNRVMMDFLYHCNQEMPLDEDEFRRFHYLNTLCSEAIETGIQ